MMRLDHWKEICALILFCAATAIASSAQTFTTLVTFDVTDGSNPSGSLIQGTDGNFYGTTPGGGENVAGGTVFKITPGGALTTLYNFCSQAGCIDGEDPRGSVVQGRDGLYGTTVSGGTYSLGTVFKITPEGKAITLYSFCAPPDCNDGNEPRAPLTQGRNGDFYGTTLQRGVNDGGTLFEITPLGQLTTLYSFCALANCVDGEQPSGGLVQATNGDLYGEASAGGTARCGTIFEITPEGKLTKLFSFHF